MRVILLFLLVAIFSCKNKKRYHDEVKKDETAISDIGPNEYFTEIEQHRDSINKLFRNVETSPLSDNERKVFKNLDFFPADSAYRVKAKFVRTANEKSFLMPTTTNRKAVYTKYGELHFSLFNKDQKLNVYQNTEIILTEGYEDYLFLPFTDLTNGEQTYGGGRYIDMRIPVNDFVTLDFNKAYNPYCTYNEKYSCPIVPGENDLDVEIMAGVKNYK